MSLPLLHREPLWLGGRGHLQRLRQHVERHLLRPCRQRQQVSSDLVHQRPIRLHAIGSYHYRLRLAHEQRHLRLRDEGERDPLAGQGPGRPLTFVQRPRFADDHAPRSQPVQHLDNRRRVGEGDQGVAGDHAAGAGRHPIRGRFQPLDRLFGAFHRIARGLTALPGQRHGVLDHCHHRPRQHQGAGAVPQLPAVRAWRHLRQRPQRLQRQLAGAVHPVLSDALDGGGDLLSHTLARQSTAGRSPRSRRGFRRRYLLSSEEGNLRIVREGATAWRRSGSKSVSTAPTELKGR